MRRIGFVILLVCMISFPAWAEWSLLCYAVSDVPDTIFPYLNQRKELERRVDLADTTWFGNDFGGRIRVKSVDSVHVSIQVADDVTFELLLQNRYKGDTVYVIQTVCSPVCNSVVTAYDMSRGWNPLFMLQPPFKADFYSATVENGEIVFTDRTPLSLDEEEKKFYPPHP